MSSFDYLLALPGDEQERRWLQERLETLSVHEGVVLAAAAQRTLPENMEQAINCLQSLDGYTVRLGAGSYAELGKSYLLNDTRMPMDALPFVDLDAVGRQYEDRHPGLFVGDCYVKYPKKLSELAYRQGEPLPEDNGWSVKLKLASPAVPEGVWLRPLGGTLWGEELTAEEALALRELRVQRWDECDLLDTWCVLPQAGVLMEQYDSVTDLIYDGSSLGYVLAERGQGSPGFMERYAAALELEGCHDLRLALDISQNLRCYDWLPSDGPEDIAAKQLREAGISDELIHSGNIDLTGYGSELLAHMGYTPVSDGSGYIRRNEKEFYCQFSIPTPEESGMTMQ